LQVLRRGAERHERMDLAAFPHLGPALDHDMRIDPGPAADADVLTDHGVGAHAHIVGQLGLGVHDGGLMHLGAHGSASGAVVPSVTIAINSASQTRLPSSSPSHRIFHYAWPAFRISPTNRTRSPGRTGFRHLAF